MSDVELSAREILANLRNYNFDVFVHYKMDFKEAEKLIYVLENMLQREG